MNPQLEEQACLYVLDELAPGERAAFEARLVCEPELAELVSEIESALAGHINALPKKIPRDSLLARIEETISDQKKVQPPVAPFARPARWGLIARWGIAAAIAIGLGILAAQRLLRSDAPLRQPSILLVGLDPSRSALTRLELRGDSKDPDARFALLASLAESLWEKPNPLTAKAFSMGRVCSGYAIFDPSSNQGFIAVQQLPEIDPGKRYHLWIIDTASGSVREAGILPLSGSASGLYSFSITSAPGASSEHLDFLVTAEDNTASDPVRPSGKIVLGKPRFF